MSQKISARDLGTLTMTLATGNCRQSLPMLLIAHTFYFALTDRTVRPDAISMKKGRVAIFRDGDVGISLS